MSPDDFAAILAARFPIVCAFRFDNGNPCHAGEAHPVHHGKWRFGPEPNHDYVEGDTISSDDDIVNLAPLLLDLWRAALTERTELSQVNFPEHTGPVPHRDIIHVLPAHCPADECAFCSALAALEAAK